jgi:hypothetical protein
VRRKAVEEGEMMGNEAEKVAEEGRG